MLLAHSRTACCGICVTVLLTSLAIVTSGCGPSIDRSAVKGTVTLDGKPLEVGSIVFTPVSPNSGPNAGDTIIDGEYDIPAEQGVVPGLNRVEIRSVQKTGRKIVRDDLPGNPLEDERVQVLPARYNSNSTLQEDIAAGENTIDFALTSESSN